jgi:glutamine synthetase
MHAFVTGIPVAAPARGRLQVCGAFPRASASAASAASTAKAVIPQSLTTPQVQHSTPRMAAEANAEAVLDNLCALPLPAGLHMAEYIWIDGDFKVRAKGRTVSSISLADLPDWNFDGSSTGQAPGSDSEVILKPAAVYRDPFRPGDNVLVMCSAYTPAGEPIPTNTRHACNEVMEKAAHLKPWFGLEQEYFLFDPATGKPLGFPEDSEPAPQGPYYCGVGAGRAFGRKVVEAAWRAQLYAGLKVSGINAEVAPGQWEFQVGPCLGIEEGDMMWCARYILERVAEIAGLEVNYLPKPITGDWNGSGCHTNFSTEDMRLPGGYEKAIVPALEKLAAKHDEHIAAYGEGNDQRLTGKHETASISKFSWGVADRGASCRVGNDTAKKGYGYFEDRRPAGNCDSYVVSKMLVSTCCEVSDK